MAGSTMPFLDDHSAEASAKEDIKLYRVTDSVGQLEMSLEVRTGQHIYIYIYIYIYTSCLCLSMQSFCVLICSASYWATETMF
eukprot:COSAG06_NODE_2503_length_6752_cov_51.525778_3_plen_83_part_00